MPRCKHCTSEACRIVRTASNGFQYVAVEPILFAVSFLWHVGNLIDLSNSLPHLVFRHSTSSHLTAPQAALSPQWPQ